MDTSFRAARGFTLVELMIALAVVAILAAVAYPSYVNQLRQSRRTDAKTALLDLAARQERFFSVNNVYAQTPAQLGYAAATGFPIDVLSGGAAYYRLATTVASAGAAFTATAAPVGAQAPDPCGSFSIDHLGLQNNANNSLPAARCW